VIRVGAAAIALAICCGGCATASRGAARSGAPGASLETHIGQIRALSAAAKPRAGNGSMAQSLETWDARLAAALRDLDASPSAEQHRRVAAEYRRLHVLDMAYTHFTRAIALDPAGPAAFDGRARIWRDWGFARLGLPDAYAAAQLAPDSPVIANTIGTLLAAAGQTGAARGWYARALQLDAHAAYALNNLCYVDFLAGRAEARAACEQAAALAPEFRDARQNLALVYAADGDFDSARRAFAAAAGFPGDAEYNMGIVYMASGQFTKAAAAFGAARAARPAFALAADRQRQAAAAAGRQEKALVPLP
jgi:Flp pilus assembly protein TadD